LIIREKPVTSTAHGELLLRYVHALRLLESDALKQLTPSSGAPQPTAVALAINADSLASWFEPVTLILARDLNIALEIVAEDQDFTQLLLARGDVIGCISSAFEPAQGFVAEPLGTMTYRCVASKAFAAQYFPKGLTVEGVLNVAAVLFNRKDKIHPTFLEARFGVSISNYPRHYMPSPRALLHAVRSGMGYAVLPEYNVMTHLLTGELVELAPEHPVDVDLWWHHWKTEPDLLKKVTDLIKEALDRLGVPGRRKRA
jgi:LysR family transcriptional regulator (chromosome initiation inhibitor)